MTNFSQNIHTFQQYGVYIYKFDEVGNLIFNSSSADFSQVYIAFPLNNVVYDNNKIKSFYNLEFEEFIPTSNIPEVTASITTVQEQLSAVTLENESLKSQLNSYITQSEANSTGPNQLAIQQVILELRKAAGEGRVDSDFSDTFPYTPIGKTT